MHYLTSSGYEERPKIDGAILQAPVSDREALVISLPPGAYERGCLAAAALVAAGKGEEILPSSETSGFFPSPVCARRWLSLASPHHDGEDDYFSSDLSDSQLEKTFGSLKGKSKLSILYSGSDEYVPDFVDKEALVSKWVGIVEKGGGEVDERSGVVLGATHNLEGDSQDVVGDLVGRVNAILGDL